MAARKNIVWGVARDQEHMGAVDLDWWLDLSLEARIALAAELSRAFDWSSDVDEVEPGASVRILGPHFSVRR